MIKSTPMKTVSSFPDMLARYAKQLRRNVIRASGLVEFAAQERRARRRGALRAH